MSREMPATFLELAQRLVWESHDVSGGPSSVAEDSRQYRRHINWINWAWLDLQKQYTDWRFMFRELEAAWPINTRQRTPRELGLTGAANAKPELGWWRIPAGDFRVWLPATPAQEHDLTFQEYDAFKRQHLRGTGRTQTGQPRWFTVHPDESLLLHPIPAAAYTLQGEYYRAPRPLVGNSDEPDIPVEYRLVIVYRALTEYGGFNAANEVYQKAHYEGERMMKQLEQTQRPKTTRSGPGVASAWRGL